MIPFIKIFGLNTLSVRIPMALVGCISLFVFYKLLRKIVNEKYAIIGLAFFAICPWHVMKSRWGLESNLFPDLILWFLYLLVEGVENKNKLIYYLSFVVAGISAYAYGTSYYFLPCFIIPTLIVLIKQKKISIWQALVSILIVGIVSLPIIMYVIINTFDLPQLNLPFMTIPKLEVNRYMELTSIFSGSFFATCWENLKQGIMIFILQYDGLPWNSIYPCGTIYIFSILFLIIGLIDSIRKNKVVQAKYEFIINIWFIVSLLLVLICEPNINRINICFIPIIYYVVKGIYISVQNKKMYLYIISFMYVAFFMLFIYKYINQDFNEYGTFEAGLEEAIQYVDTINDKPIYITNKIKSNYIYVLFYTKYNTNNFVDTVQYLDNNVEFRVVKSFGKFNFQIEKKFDIIKDNVYVLKKEEKERYNLDGYSVKEFDKYIVVE